MRFLRSLRLGKFAAALLTLLFTAAPAAAGSFQVQFGQASTLVTNRSGGPLDHRAMRS